jgi:transposase
MRPVYDTSEILDAWSRGLSSIEICETLHVSRRTVYRSVNAAREIGDPRAATRIGTEANRRSTSPDRDAILALHAKCPELTMTGIAERLGQSPGYVCNVIKPIRGRAAASAPKVNTDTKPRRPHSGAHHEVVVRNGVSLPRLRCLEPATSPSAG